MSTVESSAAVAPPIGQQFNLAVSNDSTAEINVMLFASMGGGQPVTTLVWRSLRLVPQQAISFGWTYTLNFVLGAQGQLGPGENYDPVQILDAVPGVSNQITLALVDGHLQLVDARPGPPGTLLIRQDDDLPPFSGNVGVGIDGLGTFITNVQPSTQQGFGYAPQLWIGTGTFEQGQMMSTMGINTKAALTFPAGVDHAQAAFDGSSWSIEY
ncbi:hypothetical protein GCM10022243_26670 [Saccharothrix violaceirubra]|uniref:Uncharacterized protein n=1 Tax=Saccharothrix violaceirubra TaxID=413306 RepID=A0A7W7TAA0_9PSEU|nr:hypothetical protein [Saccharothrix violaceirubra]MBB4969411.1 hypothetical protein [Saccharothrix violaceirubra]